MCQVSYWRILVRPKPVSFASAIVISAAITADVQQVHETLDGRPVGTDKAHRSCQSYIRVINPVEALVANPPLAFESAETLTRAAAADCAAGSDASAAVTFRGGEDLFSVP